MRCLNSQSRSLIDTLPAYGDMVEHAPHILKILALTGAASLFSANRVYAALRDSRCFLCSSFGPFIYLPTSSRCCSNCLDDNIGTSTVPASDAAKHFGLSETLMRQIPVVKTVPGTYSHALSGIVYEGSFPVVNVRAVSTLCLIEHACIPRDAINSSALDPWRYMVSAPFPFLDKRLNRVEPGILCRGCDRMGESLGNDDEGGFIKAMRASYKKSRTAFSEEELLRHFEECEDAKTLWDQRVQERKEWEAHEREMEARYRRIIGNKEDLRRTLTYVACFMRRVTNRGQAEAEGLT